MLLITTFYLIRVSYTGNSSSPSFHPGVSLPEFLSATIPSGCLTPGIPLRRRSIRGVSLPEFLSAAVPSRCLTPRTPLRRHSLRMSHSQNHPPHSIRVSHTRNPSPPTFHPDVSHLESSSADIPPGCLTPGILPADVPPFPNVSHPKFYPADVPPFSSSLEHFL